MSRTTKRIPITSIRIDGDTQARAGTNQATVAEYAERYGDGKNFPPIIVFYDGTSYWLADGFHRLFAQKQRGATHVQCEVRCGTQEDAQWFAVGANGEHGLNRTRADKAKAVRAALLHPNGATLSDRQIATHVRVSHPFVAKHRADLEATGKITSQPKRTGRDGRTIQTGGIGRTHWNLDEMTKEEIAALFGTTVEMMDSAHVVLESGNQGLIDAVDQGRLDVTLAAHIARTAPNLELEGLTS